LIGTFFGLDVCLRLAILLYLTAQCLKQQSGPWSTWLLIHVDVTG
jgi:high-affinity iron transporter